MPMKFKGVLVKLLPIQPCCLTNLVHHMLGQFANKAVLPLPFQERSVS